MTAVLTQNLKRLRTARNLTQEQAAAKLGVSPQSISRWECGATLPDASLLPAIARLYCVTIDDLYRPDSPAYNNYAQRLAAMYEATHAPEDFLRADMEFRKLHHTGFATAEDLRLWGILHQHMMLACRDRSLELLEQVIAAGPVSAPEAYWRTRRQKLCLMAQLGRAEEALARQKHITARHEDDENEWICLIAACQYAGEHHAAEEYIRQALERFPSSALLHTISGDTAAQLEQYDQALHHWKEALRLDPTCVDALYALGECYDQRGDTQQALLVWERLAQELTRRGYDAERLVPLQRAEACRARLNRKA